MAAKVPLGIAEKNDMYLHSMFSMYGLLFTLSKSYIPLPGSFKSPEKFAPATIPVTAGKKILKTLKKLFPLL